MCTIVIMFKIGISVLQICWVSSEQWKQAINIEYQFHPDTSIYNQPSKMKKTNSGNEPNIKQNPQDINPTTYAVSHIPQNNPQTCKTII